MKRLLILALSVVCISVVTGCVAQQSPFPETTSTTTTTTPTTTTTVDIKEESSVTEPSANRTTTGLSRQTTLLNNTNTAATSRSATTVPSRTTIRSTAVSTTKPYTTVTTRTTAVTTQRKTQVASSNDYAREVFELVNRERATEGLPAVTYRADLQSLADLRVSEIAINFSHTRPNGTSCFTVFEEAEVAYQRVGENIAQGYSTPEAVVNGWMNSSGHRANILGDYNGMVVGYADGYWVQLFIKA